MTFAHSKGQVKVMHSRIANITSMVTDNAIITIAIEVLQRIFIDIRPSPIQGQAQAYAVANINYL